MIAQKLRLKEMDVQIGRQANGQLDRDAKRRETITQGGRIMD